MTGDKENRDALERIATGVAALVALTVAQMTNPGRTKPWTQQDLIIALHRVGLRSKDIVAALGTTRNAVDPVLSRYRKTKGEKGDKRATTSTALAVVDGAE